MPRPRMLDLFCGGGGAGMGYSLAGFDVVGVDIAPQPRYPFPFVQADAMEYAAAHGRDYDAIHASPPCQSYSRMARMMDSKAPRLVEAVREALEATGRPWVIENVEGAPLLSPVLLCGTMFGLRVRRHRLFELSPRWLLLTPPCSCRNGVVTGRLVGQRTGGRVRNGRTRPPYATESDRREAIGVPWMTARQARQAIPPAYTEFIGKAILARLEAS
jgi:DNA (cytosine-5)-methyltransferase 1